MGANQKTVLPQISQTSADPHLARRTQRTEQETRGSTGQCRHGKVLQKAGNFGIFEYYIRMELLSEITKVQRIAAGGSIREYKRLRRSYGPARWRKLKGVASIRLPDGTIHLAELHWYEAHGIGKKEIKIKRLLD